MALIAVNPEILSMPSPQALPLRYLLAEDNKTWKKGEFCILTSGTVTPLVASGSTAVYGIFAEDQATSTSTSSVPVRILQIGTRLAMSVMTSGTAATAATAEIGVKYGARGLSNVSYLDTGTASGQFQVVGPLSAYDEYSDSQFDTDAAPGRIIADFTAVS